MPRHSKQATDEILIVALACGATVEQAALKADVSKRTVFRRRQDPEFRQRVADLREETVQRATGMLTASSLEAVRTLLELTNTTQPASVRLGAARAILDNGIRLRELGELTQRVLTLEKLLPQQGSAT